MARRKEKRLVAPSDLVVKMNFAVGRKMCTVEICFEEGEDALETMRSFFSSEDIPRYLETPLLASVAALFDEEQKLMSREYESAVSNSVAYERGAHQWERWYEQGRPAGRHRRERKFVASDDEGGQSVDDLAFAAAYSYMAGQWEGSEGRREELLSLLGDHRRTLSDFIAQRAEAVAELVRKQSREAGQLALRNALTFGSTTDDKERRLRELAARHSADAADVRTRHDKEVVRLKSSFRSGFRELAVNVVSELRREAAAAFSEHPLDNFPAQRMAPGPEALLHATARSETLRVLYTPEPEDVADVERSFCAPASYVPGRLLRPAIPGERFTFHLGSQKKLSHALYLYQGTPRDLFMPPAPAAIVLASPTPAASSVTPATTPQPLVPGAARGLALVSGAAERFASGAAALFGAGPPPNVAAGIGFVPVSGRAVSGAPAAAVVLVDTDLRYEWGAARALADACARSVEYHFEDLAERVDEVRRQAGGASLAPGDFFCSRHSSLASVTLVYHLIVGPSALGMLQPDVGGALLRGLRRILRAAAAAGASSIAIPALLHEATTQAPGADLERETSPEEAEPSSPLALPLTKASTVEKAGAGLAGGSSRVAALRRSEAVFRCVKAHAAESYSRGGPIRLFRFLLAPGDEPLYRQTKAQLLSTFNCR